MTIKSPDYKNVVKSIDTLLKKPPLWAADLIKQHAVYSHLVPMYRTIHREKPRKLVLRAIRWVNPENFFPMMKKSKQDIENMSKEELEESLTQLNEYREESLVISNRYDEMISIIEQGQEPYRIMWSAAKFGTLAERMDRAQNLKKGTSNWETAIDKMAVAMNRSLKDKGGDMGAIEALWDEEKGRIPFFLDRKKKGKPPLRTTRTTREGRFEEGGRPKKVADKVSPRPARFQIPSMRESLNPEIQAERDPESVEEMRQAPLYGFPEGYANQRIGTGAMVTGEQINQIARDYSGEGETPFFGHWQEELGVEDTTMRSSRFVAETENLLNALSAPAREINEDRETAVPREEPNLTFSGDPVNISIDNLDLENAQPLSEVLGDSLVYNWESVGRLWRVPTNDGRSVLLRLPPGEDPDTISENARIAFQLDRDLNLGATPRVDRFTMTFQGQDVDSYLVEDLQGRGGVITLGDTTSSTVNSALQNKDSRQSLYNLMLSDLMTSVFMDEDYNEVRPTMEMGIDPRGLFVSNNVDGHFTNGEERKLFAGFGPNEELDAEYGFPGPDLADAIPDDVEWEDDIDDYLEEIFPTLQQAQAKAGDTTTGQLWGNLVSEMTSGTGEPSIQWDEFRARVGAYMQSAITGE